MAGDGNFLVRIIGFLVIFLYLNSSKVECVRVEFYEKENYTGFLQDFQIDETKESECIKVSSLLTVASLRTDKCIMIYHNSACELGPRAHAPHDYGSLKVPQNTPSIAKPIVFRKLRDRVVSSFHVCSRERGGAPEVDVDFYERGNYRGSVIAQYKNLCGCRNLPKSIKVGNETLTSIDNHGNSIDVFEGEHCTGQDRTLTAGDTDESRKVWQSAKFGCEEFACGVFDIRSFRPTNFQDCIKLDASIYKFHFKNGTNLLNGSLEIEDVKLVTDAVMISNGSAGLEQVFSISSKVAETLDFTTAIGLSNMHTAGVDLGYEAEVEAGVPFVSKGKSKWKLGLSYRYQRTDSTTTTNRSSITNEEQITVSQKISIPPCTEAVVSTFIKKVKHFPIEYVAFARVKGTAEGFVMSAEQIRTYLGPGAKYLGKIDENTADISVDGVMHAEYGLSAFMSAQSKPVQGCVTTSTYNGNYKAPEKVNFSMEVPLHENVETS